jgi:hypothetical protein
LESEWRFNVAECAMAGSGWQLCARVVGTTLATYVVKESATTWGVFIYQPPLFMGLPQRILGPFPTAGAGSFPYGVVVVAD